MRAGILAAIAGWALAWATDARSAQIEHTTLRRVTGWVITECYQNPDQHAFRACVTHGEPWETREACRTEAGLVKGTAKGSRIRCYFVDELMVVR